MWYEILFCRMVSRLTPKQYARITHNRLTTAFFIFSFVHCFAQGVIQSFLFSIDSEYYDLLNGITTAAGIPSNMTTYLEGPLGNLHLQICHDIPVKGLHPCFDIFRSTSDIKDPAVDEEHLVGGL